MSPQESTQIQELTKAVNGLRSDLRIIHTKLFGDDDKETDQGRIPRLEAAMKLHARKLKRVEPLVLAWRAFYTVAVAVAGALISHLLPIMKGH